MNRLTARAASGPALSPEEIGRACDALLDGSRPVESRAEFLEPLHKRGETAEEIAGFVSVLLDRAAPFPATGEGALDVCGTGGDRAGIFNVSTAVMFVAAACGARVVKHGNRGVTSKSGGADVLEALGVRVDLAPDRAAAALGSAGCCFLFAPHYHPAFQAVAPVRKLLAERGSTSIFNMLGPLLNPARPSFQLAGVFDSSLLPVYARVFRLLGRRRAWAVHGTPALDEISPLGETQVVAWQDGAIREFAIRPADLGIGPVNPRDLSGGTAAANAGVISDILAGNLRNGARTIVQLNSAAALVVAGLAGDLRAGWQLAGEAVDTGAARSVLDRLRAAR
ncbi:MAG: anthranilate phosphoribosyltransferase [Verrucomicrobiae bacterium]